jgi:hypothetical protein
MKNRGQPDSLSRRDLDQVEKLGAEIDLWFQEGNDVYHVDLLDSRATSRVWWEVCRRMALAGLVVSFRGTDVTVSRPSQKTSSQPDTKRTRLRSVPHHRL